MGKAAATAAAAAAAAATAAANQTTIVAEDLTKLPIESTSHQPGSKPNKPSKPAENKLTEIKNVPERPVKKSTSPPKKAPGNVAVPSVSARSNTTPPQKSSINSAENQNATSLNGPASNGAANNNGNRRVPKSKWLPLEIELPKPRPSKPRERNNIVNSKRRERDGVTDERPRRTRVSSFRSSGSGPRTTGASTSSRTTSSATSRASGVASSKRTGPLRTTGGIQKPRYRSQNADYNLDYPVDFSLVKKLVANGSGADGSTPLLLPYMGTFYYNGVPSYAKMDTSSLKEVIKKQM